MRRSLIIAAAALLAGVAVSGCASSLAGQAVVGSGQIPGTTAPTIASSSAAPSSPPDTVTTDAPSTSAPSSVAPSSDSSSSDSSSSDSSSSDSGGPSGRSDKIPEAMFGQPLTLGKGIVVTVAPGTPYTPSDTAATGFDAKHFLQFGFTVANHTAAAFDLSDLDVDALSGGTIGSMVFDSAKDIGLPPTTTLAPNKSTTFTLALGANDPADVTLQVRAADDPPGLVLSTPPSTAPKSAAPASAGQVPFGQTFRCADGLAITAAKPKPFTPSASAAYKKAKAYVSIVVTVKNDTGAPFVMSEMDFAISSDNTDGDSIADNDVTITAPDIVLPNTASVTFTVAFSVLDPTKLQLSIAPTYDDDPAVFATG